MPVHWCKCMTSLSQESSAISAPHNLLLTAAGGFLGLAADLVLHIFEPAHRGVLSLEAVGVSSAPHGVPILHHLG